MPLVTMDLPEAIYAEVLTFAGSRLDAYLAADPAELGAADAADEADKPGEVVEGRVLKRTYTGLKAEEDAAATLNSVNEALTKLVAIAYADESDGLSYQQLADAMGTEASTVKAYRMRLGRQSYFYGKRVNPLSHRPTAEGGAVFYMASETKAAYKAALEAAL